MSGAGGVGLGVALHAGRLCLPHALLLCSWHRAWHQLLPPRHSNASTCAVADAIVAHTLARPPSHPCCSAPTIDGVQVGTVDLSVATAAVVGPTLAPSGGWTGGYNLSVCAVNPLGSCTFQACTPVKLSALTSCTLTALSQNTTYRVRAWAVQGSITSEKSNAPYFRTKLQE